MGFVFLFVFVHAVFGSTFLDKKPDKPGFYEVKFDEDGGYEYIPLKRAKKSEKEKLKANPVTAWDFRKAKNLCSVFTTVRDQKSCGGCWAFSSTDAFSGALCLNTGTDKLYSPQYLIDCPDTQKWPEGGHSYTQAGCQGGYPIIAFQTFQKTGVVEYDCVPFTGKKNTCPSKCTNSAFSTGTINDTASNLKTKLTGTNVKLINANKQSLQDLRDMVTTSGPCVAEMKVYSDLSDYKQYTSTLPSSNFDNIYETTDGGSNFEGHAVTIYGFGTEGSKNYWLVKNSWGDGWPLFSDGDNKGFFKIRMGLNESGIEDNFYALYDNENNYASVTLPAQTTPAKYWNFEDAPDCSLYHSETACEAVEDCEWQTDDEAPEDNDDDWWNPFDALAKAWTGKGARVKAKAKARRSLASTNSSASPRKWLPKKRQENSIGFVDSARDSSGALTRLANARSKDCHCNSSYENNDICLPTYRRNQTSCETETGECFTATTEPCSKVCLWYPKDDDGAGSCNAWNYDCGDVTKDVTNGRYASCEAGGANYDLDCKSEDGACEGQTCLDNKKSKTCEDAGCKWYAYAKNYFPFCDDPSHNSKCSDFDQEDCLYSIAYGLTCQVVDKLCVEGGVGKCVFNSGAWRAGVPALVVLVALLFMAFF